MKLNEQSKIKINDRAYQVCDLIDHFVNLSGMEISEFFLFVDFKMPKEIRMNALKDVLLEPVLELRRAKLTVADEKKYRLSWFTTFSEFQLENLLASFKDDDLNYKYLRKLWLYIINYLIANKFSESEFARLVSLSEMTEQTLTTNISRFNLSLNKIFVDKKGQLDGLAPNVFRPVLYKSSTLVELRDLGAKYNINVPKKLKRTEFLEQIRNVLREQRKLTDVLDDQLLDMKVTDLQKFVLKNKLKVSSDLNKEYIIEYILENAEETSGIYNKPADDAIYQLEVEDVVDPSLLAEVDESLLDRDGTVFNPIKSESLDGKVVLQHGQGSRERFIQAEYEQEKITNDISSHPEPQQSQPQIIEKIVLDETALQEEKAKREQLELQLKLERERAEMERREKERLEQERLERELRASEQLLEEEQERLRKEKLTAEQKLQEELEEEKRRLREEFERERQALIEEKERLQQEKIEAEQNLESTLAAERMKFEQEKEEIAQRLHEEKQRLEEDRLAAQIKLEEEKQRLEEEKRLEQERLEREQQESADELQAKLDEEKRKLEEEQERLEEERRLEQERLEREQEENAIALQAKAEEERQRLEEEQLQAQFDEEKQRLEEEKRLVEEKLQSQLAEERQRLEEEKARLQQERDELAQRLQEEKERLEEEKRLTEEKLLAKIEEEKEAVALRLQEEKELLEQEKLETERRLEEEKNRLEQEKQEVEAQHSELENKVELQNKAISDLTLLEATIVKYIGSFQQVTSKIDTIVQDRNCPLLMANKAKFDTVFSEYTKKVYQLKDQLEQIWKSSSSYINDIITKLKNSIFEKLNSLKVKTEAYQSRINKMFAYCQQRGGNAQGANRVNISNNKNVTFGNKKVQTSKVNVTNYTENEKKKEIERQRQLEESRKPLEFNKDELFTYEDEEEKPSTVINPINGGELATVPGGDIVRNEDNDIDEEDEEDIIKEFYAQTQKLSKKERKELEKARKKGKAYQMNPTFAIDSEMTGVGTNRPKISKGRALAAVVVILVVVLGITAFAVMHLLGIIKIK